METATVPLHQWEGGPAGVSTTAAEEETSWEVVATIPMATVVVAGVAVEVTKAGSFLSSYPLPQN